LVWLVDRRLPCNYIYVKNSCKGGINMRKKYLDNIRWITVILVVIYHVLYMYNAEGIPGTLGQITDLPI
jgi:peptidoglycan/LPS O-acetylase OafA/YrhL